jgi:methylmalonyl-CoA mutase cobalamin-binding subunit
MLTGLGNDIHTVALRLFDIEFSELQLRTVNLGPSVHPKEILISCEEFKPSVLIITTTNGEFFNWIEELKPLFTLQNKPYCMLGGIFDVGEYDDYEIEERLTSMGFDEVFSRRGNIRDICERAASIAKVRSDRL